MLMPITTLEQADPLGNRLKRLVELFDSDEVVRCEFMRYILGECTAPLSIELTRKECEGMNLLELSNACDHPAPREATAAWLSYILYMRDLLDGVEVDHESDLGILADEHRLLWLNEAEFRDDLLVFVDAVKQAMFWWNVNMLTTWMMRRLSTELKFMPLFEGMHESEIEKQLVQINRFAYMRAEMESKGRIEAALQKLKSHDSPLVTIFVVDQAMMNVLLTLRLVPDAETHQILEEWEPDEEE